MAGSHQTYTTHLEELGGGAWSAAQTKDDNGSPGRPITAWWEGARVDVQMGPKATSSAAPSSPAALPPPRAGLPNSPDASRVLLLLI